VRRTLRGERFPLEVGEIQELFQEVDEPFGILPLAGVFLSNGADFDTMFEAFIDLWNYTPRTALDGVSPVEYLRRLALATGDASDRATIHASWFCISPHNIDLVCGLALRPAPADGAGAGREDSAREG
jgi:hypothetical protein